MKNSIVLSIVSVLLASLSLAAPKCQITASDILGPYYIEGAPKSTGGICQYANDAYDQILITGQVVGDDCHTGVQAELDIWHANTQGEYSSGLDGNFDCRAKVMTDENGYYQIHSIMPGRYDDDGFRPAHIHFKIKPVDPKYVNITTQLYFTQGDNDSCGHCHSNEPSLVINLIHLDDIKTYIGRWNVALAARTNSDSTAQQEGNNVVSGPYTEQKDHIIANSMNIESLKQQLRDLQAQLKALHNQDL